MERSIQEYLKKINSRLTLYDCLSLLATLVFLAVCMLYILFWKSSSNLAVSYTVGHSETASITSENSTKPFASINGKTYTFSWCQGSGRITEKNKVYFSSEVEAQKSGRTLSKLCQ